MTIVNRAQFLTRSLAFIISASTIVGTVGRKPAMNPVPPGFLFVPGACDIQRHAASRTDPR